MGIAEQGSFHSKRRAVRSTQAAMIKCFNVGREEKAASSKRPKMMYPSSSVSTRPPDAQDKRLLVNVLSEASPAEIGKTNPASLTERNPTSMVQSKRKVAGITGSSLDGSVGEGLTPSVQGLVSSQIFCNFAFALFSSSREHKRSDDLEGAKIE